MHCVLKALGVSCVHCARVLALRGTQPLTNRVDCVQVSHVETMKQRGITRDIIHAQYTRQGVRALRVYV